MDQILEIGEYVIVNGVIAVICELIGSENLKVREHESGLLYTVNVGDIRVIPKSSKQPENFRLDPTDPATAQSLVQAAERAEVIMKYRRGELNVKQSGELLGIKKSQFYKLNKNYSEDFGPSSIVRQTAGPKIGSTRISNHISNIVDVCFDKHYNGPAASYSAVWRQVQAQCFKEGLQCPSLGTVTRLIKMHDQKERELKKNGQDAARQKYEPRPGVVEASAPLSIAQTDHTMVDLLLRAEHDRSIIVGRPWVTLIIDIYSRVILGYYISMFPPSLISVQQSLGMAALPKKMGYFVSDLDYVEYPYYGLPQIVLMDNAKEFRCLTLRAAMSKYNVKPEYRKPYKKHMGGHIERLIGTFMTTAVHFLPGTTYSNPQHRGDYNSEKLSSLTFSEFVTWFAGQVMIYHGTVHSALKKSPKDAWSGYFNSKGATPQLITNPQQFFIDFMPELQRPVHNSGIHVNGNRYHSQGINQVQGRGKITIKFDPYNLEQIWAKVGDNYVQVPKITGEHDFINYESYRCNRKFNKSAPPGTITDPDALRQVLKNNDLVKTSRKRTRAASAMNNADEARRQHNRAIKSGLPKSHFPDSIENPQDSAQRNVNFSLPPTLYDLTD